MLKLKALSKTLRKVNQSKRNLYILTLHSWSATLLQTPIFRVLKISGMLLILIPILLLSKETGKPNQLIFAVLIMEIKDKISKWITEKTNIHIMLKDKVNLL